MTVINPQLMQGRVAGALVSWLATSAPPGGVTNKRRYPPAGPRSGRVVVPSALGASFAWERADLGITQTVPGRARAWADLSGVAARDLQSPGAGTDPVVIAASAATVRPINANAAIQFDGVSQYMRRAFAGITQPYEHYVVFRQDALGAGNVNDFVFDGGVFAAGYFLQDNSPRSAEGIFPGGEGTDPTVLGNGVFTLARFLFNDAASEWGDVGAVPFPAGAIGATSPGGIAIGASANGTRPTQTTWAERVTYWPPLADYQRAKLLQYFAYRYGFAIP